MPPFSKSAVAVLLSSPSSAIRRLFTSATAAMSSKGINKWEYVRGFELDDRLLPNSWIVVRVDGKGFHKFSDAHSFAKPNDKRALDLMNACARDVVGEFVDLVFAYGQSDEYSFVFRRETDLYRRRSAKLLTNLVSHFSSSYVFRWREFFPDQSLQRAPIFDGRVVLYPSERNIRDYLSWRQADCHINNLYNTVFWALVQQGGLSNQDAMERLKGSLAKDKNEILFSEFGVNYNKEPGQFRKGTSLFRKKQEVQTDSGGTAMRSRVVEHNGDIIGDDFWGENSHILGSSSEGK